MTGLRRTIVGAVLVTALLTLARPAAAQVEPFNAPGIAAAASANVWWSWGNSTWEHDVFGLGIAGSKLEWEDVESPVAMFSGEFAWRFLVVSAAVGFGSVEDGTFIDDDFILDEVFSRTRSTVEDGEVFTFSADVGLRALRWRDHEGRRGHLDVVVGYQFWREEYEAFGAVPLIGPISVPADVKAITHEWEWHSVRLGARVDGPIWKGLRYRLGVFFLPWSSLDVDDIHHLRDDLLQNPSVATDASGGFGVQVDASLTYTFFAGLAAEVGFRYWRVSMEDGDVTFRHSDGTTTRHDLVEATTDRWGPYIGLTYRFP